MLWCAAGILVALFASGRGEPNPQHREYRPYEKPENPEQNKYWDWRHSHSDEKR
jgi:hypothetical protein